MAVLGDLDGDGVEDLAVGAHGEYYDGMVWILFRGASGDVKSYHKMWAGGGYFRALISGGQFGCSIANLGDLDGDGV